jgi:hypothetical protein
MWRRILWAPFIAQSPRVLGGETVYLLGLSIYCTGKCNFMMDHFDGRAPQCALEIRDWDRFNEELKSIANQNR